MYHAVDWGSGKDESTIVTVAAVDWQANTMYQIGDVIRISGSLSSAFGKSWPESIQVDIRFLERHAPRLRRVYERVLYLINDTLDYLFGYTFGPRKYTIARLTSANTFTVE